MAADDGGQIPEGGSKVCELQLPTLSELPHVSPIYFDRVFQLMSIEDIMLIYQAIMSEEKRILIVSHNAADLVPIMWTLLGFMCPFEWALPKVPVFWGDESMDTIEGTVNSCFNILVGMTHKAYDRLLRSGDIDYLNDTLIVDLRGVYCTHQKIKMVDG